MTTVVVTAKRRGSISTSYGSPLVVRTDVREAEQGSGSQQLSLGTRPSAPPSGIGSGPDMKF